MPLSEAQIDRYSRQIVLPEVGGAGQQRWLEARVAVVGMGGLGSAAAWYLAAAGVGKLSLVDGDVVELSNLHRQLLYPLAAVGQPKVRAAREVLRKLNPECEIAAYDRPLDASWAGELVAEHDVVVDGADNFAAKFLLNDACVAAGKPLVSGSVLRFDGQLSTFLGHMPQWPCYRCLFPEPPPPGLYPEDEECGVLGTVPGLIGALQAVEVLKLLLGVGRTLAGRLLIYSAATATFREVELRKAGDCPSCARADASRRAAGA